MTEYEPCNHLENTPLCAHPSQFFFIRPYMLTETTSIPKKNLNPLAKFCSLISNLSQIAEKLNSEVSYIQTMRYNNTTFLANVAPSSISRSGSSEL